MGGWRLAPRLLVEQLDALREPGPLVLVPRRQMRRLNSQLEFLGAAAEIVIHPDDAAGAGLSDGQPLIVRSVHGEMSGVAKVDGSIRRGAVSVPHGHAGANVNLLTSKDDIDPVTGMTRYSGVPVSLHPA
jgi:anaerobic selenocysteine-containing dehydrogenase